MSRAAPLSPPRPALRPCVRAAALLLAMALCGCQADRPDAPARADAQAPQGPVFLDSGADRQTPRTDPKRHLLLVQLHMISFEVPAGAASASERIWSYLDEESVGVQQGVSLGRNGLRIGVGLAKHWRDVQRTLRQMTGKGVKEIVTTAVPGGPAFIQFAAGRPGQTVFTFHDDRTLSGADYPPGDNVMAVVCTLDEDDPSLIRITGVPQIRSFQFKPKLVNEGGNLLIAERPDVYSLYALAFHVAVRNKDFLVIGPNLESQKRWSVGYNFLIHEKQGVPFEHVQLLMPEVYMVQDRDPTGALAPQTAPSP